MGLNVDGGGCKKKESSRGRLGVFRKLQNKMQQKASRDKRSLRNQLFSTM